MKRGPYRKKSRTPRRFRPNTYVQASQVKVTHADGSVSFEESKTEEELAKIVTERGELTKLQKQSIRKRDMDCCRYCGIYCDSSNREFEHVIPVSLGGPTTVRNMVLSCANCNDKKGVEIWTPVPLKKHQLVVKAGLAEDR